jgi:hypothetical protein
MFVPKNRIIYLKTFENMKKIFAGLTLMAFLVAGLISTNVASASVLSLDSQIDKVMVDKEPTKDNDKDKKKETKSSDKSTSKSDSKSTKSDCSSKKDCGPKTSCSGPKTSSNSKTPDKK